VNMHLVAVLNMERRRQVALAAGTPTARAPNATPTPWCPPTHPAS
jgi:hypothetical protein